MATKKPLPSTVPALQKVVATQEAQITDLRADNRRIDQRSKEAVADANKKNANFVRNLLPQIGGYAAAGFGAGFGLCWYFYDYLADYFEPGSWYPGAFLALAGGVLAWQVPKIVPVSQKHPERSAHLASAVRGAGIGVAAYGLWEAYTAWSNAPATP